ncbi:hypothetical protein MKK55_14470 [Methylobacterium sp. J-059]|uniref:hypothetical protein n=1 Tax=Methylobacterium sp. J-059 TaxID=2836643 RepID=UPI001FBAAAEA|nr:hypothetical protein [Methylobacterium sp. J-059]MCJ2040135.1 hypothetical protein [Methylobacterium sp. J-059]
MATARHPAGATTPANASSRLKRAETRTVATVRKTNFEEVRVSIQAGSGFTCIDVRVFAMPARGKGDLFPTKSGIRIARNRLPELIEALQVAEREVSQ